MHTSFSWQQHNETVFGQCWKAQQPKAIIVLVHGMGGHSGRYGTHFADFFNKNGFHLYAFDHFGHGKTTGKRGHCPGYHAVLETITHILKKATNDHPNLPVFLYGHSMGGNVVANYILKNKPDIKGAVIASPMLQLAFRPPAVKMFLGKLMLHIYPAFTERTNLDTSAISKDPAETKKYIDDALVHDYITAAFSIPFFQAGKWAIKHAHTLQIPCFLIHGTSDAVTDHTATKQFAQNAGHTATCKLYEGGYHELHNDTIKDIVLQDVLNWLCQQLEK